ncbi:MAG: 2-oxo-4-hydroxy-4-carboxy-5-ureidoimidazoline decarboxylase, partial [Solirubrobacteraceae bacterium]
PPVMTWPGSGSVVSRRSPSGMGSAPVRLLWVAPILTTFNTAGDEELRTRLASCCAADSWVERVLAGRPYADEAELGAVSDAATAELDDVGLAQALAGHPRIGERQSTHAGRDRAAVWSRQEQTGVVTAEADVVAALETANADYERRFGHVYLVCASGRSATELLDVCRARLDNDPVTERCVVLSELAKINRLRLSKLLSEEVAS